MMPLKALSKMPARLFTPMFPRQMQIERLEPMGINPGHRPNECAAPNDAIKHIKSSDNVFVRDNTHWIICLMVKNLN